jgi:hypothetical protein
MPAVRQSPSGEFLGSVVGASASAAGSNPAVGAATVVATAAGTTGSEDTRATAQAVVDLLKDAAPGVVTVELRRNGVVVQSFPANLAAAEAAKVPFLLATAETPDTALSYDVRVTSAAGLVAASATVLWQSS